MYVVDASVWVGRFVPADSHHRACRAWLEDRVERAELLVGPALLLPELAGAVARRTGSSDLANRAVKLVLQLPDVRLTPVDPALTRLAAGVAARFRLRGADSVYTALARRLGVPLVTLDAEQQHRASPSVRVVTPMETVEM